jgi:hypothetical protein
MSAISPTPWFYTIETAGKVPRCILRNNDGEFIGLIDRAEDAQAIIEAMNKKPEAVSSYLRGFGTYGDVIHTACKHCDQDIEGIKPFVKGDWRDRGNNRVCPSGPNKDKAHEPIE